MQVTTESLQAYVGGQVEVQGREGYLYRGEIEAAEANDESLTLRLAWTAQGEGFPPFPTRWVKADREAFTADLMLYSAKNIGPGQTGSDRLYLSRLDGNEIVVLFPPDGSKLKKPD